MKRFSLATLASTLCLLAACSSSSGPGDFSNTGDLAIDSTNNRVFVVQSERELLILEADTGDFIEGDQPVISEDNNPELQDLLPSVVTNFSAYSNGDSSRLFIQGAFADDNGNLVTNEIRVLDFDGSSFSEPDFSPIVLSDGDDATDESDDSFADLIVDQENGYVFVSDATAGKLYVADATTGDNVVAPLTIAGAPQGLALDTDRVYVCNSSSVEAEQVVTVVNTENFSTTQIDLDRPCSVIGVDTAGDNTVLLAKDATTQVVVVRAVDATTYANSTELASATEGIADGALTAGDGISSGVNKIVLSHDENGNIYAYLSEQDGNIGFVTVASGADSFSFETVSVNAINVTEGKIYTNPSDGTDTTVYFTAESGYLVKIAVGSNEADLNN